MSNTSPYVGFEKNSLALALEPRMMFDAAAVATAAAVAESTDTTHHVPTVTADTNNDAAVTIDKTGTVSGAVNVFSHASVSANDDGQTITNLVVTVDQSGTDQALVIDGKDIALTEDKSGVTSNNHYSYTVTTSAGKTTINISIESSDTLGADSANSVATLIDGIQYKALSSDVSSGTVNVSLTKITDSGSDNNAADLNISATVSVTNNINVAPDLNDIGSVTLADAISNADLGSANDVLYSSDGKYAYVANDKGSIAVYALDAKGHLTNVETLSGLTDVTRISGMVESSDGKSIYVINNSNIDYDDPDYDSINNSVIVQLSVDSQTGKLSYVSSTSVGDTTVDIAISKDGSQVYLASEYNGLYVYTRDAATGALTQLTRFDDLSKISSMTSVGDYVYIANRGLPIVGTPDTLVVLQRDKDGNLTQIETANLPDTGSFDDSVYQMTVSSDGQFVYVANQVNSSLMVYQLSTANGQQSLSLINTISTSNEAVNSMVLSSDNNTLYTVGSNGDVTVYSVDSKTHVLTQTAIISGLTGATDISLSADGKSLLVSGNTINRLTGSTDYVYGETITIIQQATLSDSNFDALNGGLGDYKGASVSIQRENQSSADDVFGFKNTDTFTLDGTTIKKDGVAVATLTQVNGVMTLTFTGDMSKADANAILRQVTYQNVSAQAADQRITLAVTASDGELNSATKTIDLYVGINKAPTVITTPVGDTNYNTTGDVTSLFKNTNVSTGESGQNVSSFTINVASDSGVFSNESVTVDGVSIDLTQSSSGTTTQGYHYSYTLTNGVGTLVISSSTGVSSLVTQNMINGMTYQNNTEQSYHGTRTFTITEIKDDGGTDNGGVDTSALALAATVSVAINHAPTVSADNTTPDATMFYNDGTLSGYSNYVTNVSISENGTLVVISGTSSSTFNGTSYLQVFSRNTTTGALTLVQTFTQGLTDDASTSAIEVNGLNAVSTVVISPDGQSVYVAGYADGADKSHYSIVQFEVNSDSTLTYKGIVATQGENGVVGLDATVSEMVFSADGKSLYTINGVTPIDGTTGKSTISFFSRDTTTGNITFVGDYAGGSVALGLYNPSGIVVSHDGKSVYVSNASGSMITVLSRDTDTGKLTYVTEIDKNSIAKDTHSGEQNSDDRYLETLEDIVISPDDKYVYVSSNTMGMISVFSRDAADGHLTFVNTVETYGVGDNYSLTLSEMAMSADGKALYVTTVGGRAILIFSRDADTGLLTYTDQVATSSNVNHFAVSKDGLSIYGGATNFVPGLNVFHATPNSHYIENTETTIVAGITLDDIDFDQNDNYEGLTFSIYRKEGPNGEDVFGFKAGNGYTLADNVISYNGTAIARMDNADGALKVTFTAEASKTQVNSILHQITYSNTNSTDKINLLIHVSDGDKSSDFTLAVTKTDNVIQVDNGFSLAEAATNNDYRVSLDKLFTNLKGNETDISVSGLPAGFTYDAKTNTITGRVSETGTYQLTLHATDSAGNAADVVLTLTVAQNQAPTVDTSADSIPYTHGDDAVSLLPSGTLDDKESDTANNGQGDYAHISVTINRKGNPDAADVFSFLSDSTYKFADNTVTKNGDAIATLQIANGTVTITFAQNVSKADANAVVQRIAYQNTGTETGDIKLNVAVNDGDLTTTNTVNIHLNTAPAVNAEADTATAEGIAGRNYNAALPANLFTDADGDTLTYSVKGLPDGLSFDGQSFSGKVTQSGTYNITVTAKDPSGATAEQAITLTFNDNIAPVVSGSATLPLTDTAHAVQYTLPADLFSDANKDTLTVSVSGLPDGITFDTATQTFSGTAQVSGQFTLVITATDPSGATVSYNAQLNVANTAPTVSVDSAANSYTEKQPAVPVFTNAGVDLHGDHQTVKDIVLSVANVADQGKESLVIDGSTIDITSNNTGTTTHGYQYTVTFNHGKATIDVHTEAGLSAQATENLLNQVAYVDSSLNPTSDTARIVTLVSVSNEGDSSAGGAAEQIINQSVNLQIIPVNDPPTPVADEVYIPTATANNPFSYHLSGNLFVDPEGDTFTMTVDPDTLPAGLQFDAQTGTIQGVPLNAGNVAIKVIATDSHGAQSQLMLVMEVNAGDNYIAPSETIPAPVSTVSAQPAFSQAPTAMAEINVMPTLDNWINTTVNRPVGFVAYDLNENHIGLRDLPFYLQDQLNTADTHTWPSFNTADLVRQGIHIQLSRFDSEYQLPQAFLAQHPGDVMSVRSANGAHLPAGVSIDAQRGVLHVGNIHGEQRLILVVKDAAGKEIAIPVSVNKPSPQAMNEHHTETKPAVTAQIQAESSGLAQEIHAFLAKLNDAVAPVSVKDNTPSQHSDV